MAEKNHHGADELVREFDLNSAMNDIANQEKINLNKGPDVSNIAGSSKGNTNPTEDLIMKISDQDAPTGVSPSPSLSGRKDLEVEPKLSLGPSLDNVGDSFGAPAISRQEDEGRLSGRDSTLTRKGKELLTSEAGSSSDPRLGQGDNIPPSDYSMQSSARGVMTHPFPPQHPVTNMAGLHVSADHVPHYGATSAVYPGMPQGYYNQHMHLTGHPQNPMLFNAFETINAPLHSDFRPPHPFYHQPRWLNGFGMGMSPMMLGPYAWTNVPYFPSSVDPNRSVEVLAGRGQALGMRNFSQHPGPQSAPIVNVGGYNGGAFAELYHWPGAPKFYDPSYGPTNQQAVPEYHPWAYPQQNNMGLDAPYMDVTPYPHHATHEYFMDTVRVPGHANQSHNLHTPGSLPSQPNSHLAIPVAQPMEVPTNTEDMVIPEMLMILNDPSPSLLGDADLLRRQDVHREMRLDVDNMLYEACAGLPEDTIMDLLKKRTYESGASDASAEPETCSICREEYRDGEEIGALECGHEFHTGCIKEWLVLKNECPFCKKALGSS